MPAFPVKVLLAVGVSWLQIAAARALTADRFELHAVANTASERTRDYATVADGGVPAQTEHLDQTVLLDGTAVQTLTCIPAHDGTPLYLNVRFTPAGKQRYAELTAQYLKRKLGVVVDGRLIMAPVIQDIIYGGSIGAGKDPHEFPYPNFWLPLLHPEVPAPRVSSLEKKQP